LARQKRRRRDGGRVEILATIRGFYEIAAEPLASVTGSVTTRTERDDAVGGSRQ